VEYIKYNKMAQKCCIRILYHELINNAHWSTNQSGFFMI
jgi:hypothetical protein